MFIVLLQGALVTKTGSAEGCGRSWPLCEGSLLPTGTLESFIEYSHRAVSGIVGILVVLMAIQLWKNYRDRPEMRFLLPLSVGLMVVQSGLGAAAVMWPQPKVVLALHFGVSLSAFAAVLLPTVLLIQLKKDRTHRETLISPRLRFWIWASLIYTYAVVYSGAYVRHTNSHLACLDWPLCNGQLIPELSGPVGIQFFHRLSAAGVVLILLWLVYVAYKERNIRPEIYKGSLLALVLAIMQVLVGGWVILSFLTLPAMMVHSALVTALFGVLSYLCMQALPEPEPVEEGKAAFVPVRS